jgi:Immunity protein 42
MINLVGDKNIFAVEFEILEFASGLNSMVRFWINNNTVGDFNEIGYLSAVIGRLNGITDSPSKFWLPELSNLSCKDMFYTITPFYNNPNDFFDLPEDEQEKLIRYDVFISEWGDAFDDWDLKTVINNGICKFLWVHAPLGDEDSYEVRNNIQCFDVKLEYVQEVYKELAKLIPYENWPSMIPRC